MINLFEEMSKLVDKVVKNYQSDFEIDKQIILAKPKKYYWFLRSAGTDIYDSEKVLIKETEEYGSIDYYLTQSRVEAIYEIQAMTVDGVEVMGSMKKIPLETFKKFMRSAKEATEKEKFKLLIDFASKPIWATEELESLKRHLFRQMQSYGLSKDFIQAMLMQKSHEEINNLIKSQSEIVGAYAA